MRRTAGSETGEDTPRPFPESSQKADATQKSQGAGSRSEEVIRVVPSREMVAPPRGMLKRSKLKRDKAPAPPQPSEEEEADEKTVTWREL